MLYPVVNDLDGYPFCGPTAISSITGHSISKVEDRLKEYRDINGRIKGIQCMYVLHSLRMFGYYVKGYINWLDTKWLKGPSPLEFEQMNTDGPYLLLTENHFVAYSEGEFVDTSNHFPCPFERWPGRFKPYNKSIETAYKLELRRVR